MRSREAFFTPTLTRCVRRPRRWFLPTLIAAAYASACVWLAYECLKAGGAL